MELASHHGLGRHSERLPGWIALSALAHVLAFSTGGVVAPTNTPYRSPPPLVADIRPITPETIAPPEVLKPEEDIETQARPAEALQRNPDQEAPTSRPPSGAAVESPIPLDIYLSAVEVDVGAEPSNQVFLVYPWMAYAQRLAGKVMVTLLINEHGGLDKVTVIDADPPGIFEAAAFEAVNKLRFTPARKNGRKVKSRKTIEVVFDPSEHLNHPAQM